MTPARWHQRQEQHITDVEPFWPILPTLPLETEALIALGMPYAAANEFPYTMRKLGALLGSHEMIPYINRKKITFRAICRILNCFPSKPANELEAESQAQAWAAYVGDKELSARCLSVRYQLSKTKAHQLIRLHAFLWQHDMGEIAFNEELTLPVAMDRFRAIAREMIPVMSAPSTAVEESTEKAAELTT
jgi:hypothetical protein